MPQVTSPSGKPKLSVGFILLPEFTLSALAGFVDTLRLSADENFESRQVYCSWTILNFDLNPVKSSCGAKITPWEVLREPIDFDCLVVVGGLVKGHEKVDRRITDYVARAHANGKLIIGLCTGSFALAYAGLMRQRITCVHWFHKPDFQMAFPDHAVVTDVVYYEDENCLTCAGGGASGDVAAFIVERYCGKAVARMGVSGMIMEKPRSISTPQPHLEAEWFSDVRNLELRRSILVMDRSIRKTYRVEALARKAGLHKVKLDRLFRQHFNVSAAVFFRVLRLAHGNRDVLYSERTITDIAVEYGFSDASHFTKLYRSCTGVTPSEARELDPETSLSNISFRLADAPQIIRDLMAGKLLFSSMVGLSGAAERFGFKHADPRETV